MPSKSSSDSSVKNTSSVTTVSESGNVSTNNVANISGSYNRTDSGGNTYIGDIASKAGIASQLSAAQGAGGSGIAFPGASISSTIAPVGMAIGLVLAIMLFLKFKR